MLLFCYVSCCFYVRAITHFHACYFSLGTCSLHCCSSMHIGVSLCTIVLLCTCCCSFLVWHSSNTCSFIATHLHVRYYSFFALLLFVLLLRCNSLYSPYKLKIVSNIFYGWRPQTLIQISGWTRGGAMLQQRQKICF